MVKIKIPKRNESDVSRMMAKGWNISIFRGKNLFGFEDFITIEKGCVKFWVGYIRTNTTDQDIGGFTGIEIKKYVDGKYDESKIFYDTGDGLVGTIFITDSKTIGQTYAFFRNASLMEIIEEFELRRIEFPKTSECEFEKTIKEDFKDLMATSNWSPVRNTMPPFHTDGTYEIIDIDEENRVRTWQVSGATYIYEYNSATLTIPQVYSIDKVRAIMDELTEGVDTCYGY